MRRQEAQVYIAAAIEMCQVARGEEAWSLLDCFRRIAEAGELCAEACHIRGTACLAVDEWLAGPALFDEVAFRASDGPGNDEAALLGKCENGNQPLDGGRLAAGGFEDDVTGQTKRAEGDIPVAAGERN